MTFSFVDHEESKDREAQRKAAIKRGYDKDQYDTYVQRVETYKEQYRRELEEPVAYLRKVDPEVWKRPQSAIVGPHNFPPELPDRVKKEVGTWKPPELEWWQKSY